MMNTSGAGNKAAALHARRYGARDRPKLLILHGLLGFSANWRSIAKRLAATCEVFCLDLRNHGASPWHDDMTYADLAGDVARFIADHDLHDAAVLGHSMGGKTAMMLAQAQLASPRKLIVVDIAPIAYPSARHQRLLEAMRAVDLGALRDRAQLDFALAARVPDAGTRAFLAQNLRAAPDGYRWQLNLDAIQRNLPALCGYPDGAGDAASAVETLFIAGANANYITFERAADGSAPRPHRHRDIFGRFPNARVEVVADAGHWLHIEQPARLIALCESFLAA